MRTIIESKSSSGLVQSTLGFVMLKELINRCKMAKTWLLLRFFTSLINFGMVLSSPNEVGVDEPPRMKSRD